jgi:uncharacterized membrane protein YphA (DoxX/SURF4 family)
LPAYRVGDQLVRENRGVEAEGAGLTHSSRQADGSGPLAARVFDRMLAVLFLIAFASLGVQLHTLVGSRGLLPLAPLVERLWSEPSFRVLDFPSLFLLDPSDAALTAGIVAGIALSGAALLGLCTRVAFALLTALYLSYAVACRDLLSFQWDNLLLECGLLAALLPRDRPALLIHLLLRLVLFKLYFESGIAKWQSRLGDWQDGSAMMFYYETAPLPSPLAWYAHQLPATWHQLESRAVLVLELVLPIAIFGPRVGRLAALAVFSGFQALNLATANYGFFCYLALTLHVFLLDDRDLTRVWSALGRRVPWLARVRAPRLRPRGPAAQEARAATRAPSRRRLWVGRVGAALLVIFSVGGSLNEALCDFADWPGWREAAAPVRRLYAPLRLVNTYHLFGHITRERVEPDFQTLVGDVWSSQYLHFKPGPLDRAPPFVAPHQPRVDFRLWFYGLGFRSGVPEYVVRLVGHLCRDPAAVQPLFASALPAAPAAVRIAFDRYRFTTPEERARSGAWWTRSELGSSQPIPCDQIPAGH